MDEDPQLLHGFVARQAWAYETAYRLYGRVLYSAAFAVLGADGDAQDCVHDVLLRLWRRGDVFQLERGSLRAFLAVCVRNEALSRSRKGRNRERIGRIAGEPAQAPAFDDAVVQREDVRTALESLSHKQRRSIVLAYYQGLTHEQVAEQLGEPIGTIKSRLSASLRQLRDLFAAQEGSSVEF